MNYKGCHNNNNLTLYEGDKIVKDEIEVSGILNDLYINKDICDYSQTHYWQKKRWIRSK